MRYTFQALRSSLRDKIGSLSLWVLSIVSAMPSYGYAQFKSRVSLGLAGDAYMTRDNVNNGQAHGALLIENKGDGREIFIDIGAGGLIGESSHTYIKAPQFYYRWGKTENFNVTLGRLKQQWSLADDFWNMGLTQPLFLWDAARPQKQGLIGLFLDVPTKRFHFTLFASYFFLPTQGASYENLNGKLSSSNPWFADPIEAVSFGGQRFDLNYVVDVPDASKVILQPSVGFRLSSREESSTIARAFYLLKPRNDLVLPFEGALNGATLKGDIVVRPRVAQHHVAGLDTGFRYGKNWQLFASWIHEGGIEYSAPENTSYPDYPDQNIYSLTSGLRLNKKNMLWLSYIHVVRSVTRLKGVFDSSTVNAFGLRNRFERALRLKGEFKVFAKAFFNVNYTYDTLDQGSWVSSYFKWAFSPYFDAFAQCDLFGSPNKAIVGNHFIDRYQNNDRCLVGSHYAF